MSLILDALRKAERERELGQVPTIGSQLPLRRRPAAGRGGRWIAGVLLVAVAAACIVAWALRDRWWPADVATDDVAASSTAVPPDMPGGTPAPAADGTTTVVAPEPAPAPAPVATAPDPADEVRRVAEQALAMAEAAKREAEKATAVAAGPEVASTPVGTPPADAPPAPAPMAPASDTPAAAGTALEPDASGGTLPAPVAEADKPLAEPPASEPPPPPVPLAWELPLGVRQSLPALSVAMHVYAEEPTRRFVILNDQRLVEGESAGAGVTVREIRRDGVVLEYQGQRFLLPRGGL